MTVTKNKSSNGEFTKTLSEMHDQLSSGLSYTHTRINFNTTKTLESSSFLYALVELLDEKGLLSIEELDERKKQVAGRLVQKFKESGVGLMCQDPEHDKYTFKHVARVDCYSRLHICKAICCKFPFALSKQDVEERIIRWDFGRPYLIAHGDDGYCVHLDQDTYRCTVHERRPVPCRGFDCKDNNKWTVWDDFDHKRINAELIGKLNAGNY